VAADQAPVLTVCDRWDDDGAATVTVLGEIDAGTAPNGLDPLDSKGIEAIAPAGRQRVGTAARRLPAGMASR
jgi:hypothetical protein